jgi:hypothetical protein
MRNAVFFPVVRPLYESHTHLFLAATPMTPVRLSCPAEFSNFHANKYVVILLRNLHTCLGMCAATASWFPALSDKVGEL